MGDVADVGVLRLLQIVEDGAGSDDSAAQVLHTEALEALHIEVLQQLLHRALLGKHPVVHLEGDVARAEIAFKVLAAVALVEHLLRLEIAQQLLHVVVGSLANEVFARRDVEEGNATGSLAEVHGTEEVVLLVVQHVVREGHAGGHQLGDAALHKLLRQFRVLQLVANGHTLSGADEFRQVCIESMVGESRHLVALVIAVVALGEGYAQYARGRDGIVTVGLVEVAAAEQQHRVGVLRLQVEELLHHRGQLPAVFMCCHLLAIHLLVAGCKGTKNYASTHVMLMHNFDFLAV